MPGLAGLITRMPRERAEADLLRMIEAQRHESWYASGTWSDEGLGVYIGWMEGSESVAKGMPLFSEGRDLMLAHTLR